MTQPESFSFEQGPIRPPSEAGSLLIRVVRNCPWNKCAFCGTYKGKEFSRRTVSEIKADIDTVKTISDKIFEMSWKAGGGGKLTRAVFTDIMRDPTLPDSFRSVAFWLASGAETVFLQDADALLVSTETLQEILSYLREMFPSIKRVTSYARGSTLKLKSVEDYRALRDAGLSRLHVGMESGSHAVLSMIQKGAKPEWIIEGGKKVVSAGISLCLYIIPGIGGKTMWRENAVESAKVVNAINPNFVRFRSLYVRKRSPLADMVREGVFQVPSEDEIVAEIRLFVENLEGITTTLVSDHILNLLEEVEGKLPEDKERILGVMDRYAALSDEERELFQLGRRGGALSRLDELSGDTRDRLRIARTQIQEDLPGGITEYIEQLKRQFV